MKNSGQSEQANNWQKNPQLTSIDLENTGNNLLPSGIEPIPGFAWATHFCQFYRTKQDLLDVLAPYFKAGLKNNEVCVWVTSEFLNAHEARQAMAETMPDFSSYLEKGQMEIIPYTDFYLKDDKFEFKRVLGQWAAKHDQALASGYAGLRVSGNPFWLTSQEDWDNFTEYEAEINKVINNYKILVLCTYSLDQCGASEVIDVVNNHQFSLIKRAGKWEIIESAERRRIKELLQREKELSENIIKAIPDGLSIVDENRLIVHHNKIFEDLFGAEAIGKACHEVYKDDKKICANCPLNKTVEVGQTKTNEVSGIAGGRTFLISHTGIMIEGKKHILEIFKDITGFRQARESVDLEKAKLKKILDTMKDGVYIVNQKYEMEYVNPALEKILGKADGRKCYDYLHNFKQVCAECNLKEVCAGKTIFSEWYYPKTKRTYEFLATPLKNDDGSVSKLHISHDITNRKQTENALRASLDRYQSHVEVTGQIGWTTNPTGEVVDDIPSWRKFTGQTYDQVKGGGWTVALHPDDLKKALADWDKAVKTKSNYETRYRLRRHDGVYRYFMARGTPVFNNKSELVEWVGTCVDITEHEQLEKKMEHLASFPRLNPNPVIETDEEGNIMFFNAATLEVLKKLGVGYNVNIFLPDDIAEIFKSLKEEKQVKVINREIKIKNKIFKEELFLPKNLNVLRLYVMDITEQKKNMERLAEERKIVETIIENTDTLLVYFDCDFNYTWVNSAYAASCDKKIDELVGKNYFSIFPDKENEILFNQAKANGQTVKVKAKPYVYSDKPELGVTYWDWLLTPIKNLSGEVQGFVYSVADVTETKRAEEKKNNFIAIMSHELRNPLAPILTSAQLINAQLQNGSAAAKAPILTDAVNVIEKQAKNMGRMLDDLLDIARISHGKIQLKKQPVNLCDSLENVIKVSRPLLELQKQTLTLSLPAEPIYLKADPLRLEQIVMNLLNNAIKYTPAGGRIWLKAKRLNGEVEIRVRDNGIGMEPNKINTIFDLFSRLSNSYVSTQGELGVGLKLTKDLIAMHHGTITASSAGISQGSEFIVRLPALAESGSAKPILKKPTIAVEEKPRLLIIDDNQDIANMQAELFNFYGYETKTFYDGPSALALAPSFWPKAALIDIGMPLLDGYEVARKFREMEAEAKQKITLIAATGYGQEEDKRRSREAGFDHHLVKPIDINQILSILKDI